MVNLQVLLLCVYALASAEVVQSDQSRSDCACTPSKKDSDCSNPTSDKTATLSSSGAANSSKVADDMPEMEVEGANSSTHDCRTRKHTKGNCTARSCAECACASCGCPHRTPKTDSERDSGENLFNCLGSDFFAFLTPAFHEKAVQAFKHGSKLFESLPESLRELASKHCQQGESLLSNVKQKYADLKSSSYPFSTMFDLIEKQFQSGTPLAESDDVCDETLGDMLCAKEELTPILFVPGLLGSALEEKRSNATWLPRECFTPVERGWSRNWVSITSLLEFHCWREVLKLSVDDSSNDLMSNQRRHAYDTVTADTSFFGKLSRIFSALGDILSLRQEAVHDTETFQPGPILSTSKNKNHPDFSKGLMKTQFPPGIEIRPITDGIDATRCLDNSNMWTCQATSYFKDLLSFVTRRIAPSSGKHSSRECPQYALRKNIDVLPFDFRLGGYELYNPVHSVAGNNLNEYGGFFAKMKAKIEEMYSRNNGLKVAVVTHSLGGPLTSTFMNTYVDDAWKKKYMKKMVTVAAPFGGAIKALQASLIGETESVLIPTWSLQSLLSSWPGMYMVYPTESSKKGGHVDSSPAYVEIDEESHAEAYDESTFASISRFIGSTARQFFTLKSDDATSTESAPLQKLYTAKDLAKLIRAHPNIPSKYATHLERMKPLQDIFRQPPSGVDIDCIFSTGVQTTRKLVYKTLSEDDVFTPEVVMDREGDGTVRLESLSVCRDWETDANIDVDVHTDAGSQVDLHEAIRKVDRKPRGTKPIRRTIQLHGIDHLRIIVNSPQVWKFILQSVNSE